jgi:hypothetical protein
MDAMQKQRMRQIAIVAIAHFVLSVWFCWTQIEIIAGSIYESPYDVWCGFVSKTLILLQPQCWLVLHNWQSLNLNTGSMGLLKLSIPLWSICFGYFLIKAVSWRSRHSSLVTRHF